MGNNWTKEGEGDFHGVGIGADGGGERNRNKYSGREGGLRGAPEPGVGGHHATDYRGSGGGGRRAPEIHVGGSNGAAPSERPTPRGDDSLAFGGGSGKYGEAPPASSGGAAMAMDVDGAPATTSSGGGDLGDDDDDQMVPTVFRWEHGGRQVFVTGTFNNWDKQIPMHRSGNDFTYIHNLKKGKHAFKFVVDDEWRFAPDQPTVADIEGRINNFIDVTDFDAYTGDENFLLRRDRPDGDDLYTREIPDLDEYTKDPPPLPPHLRHIILNKAPPSNDPNALPTPQHVALNHLYCTAIKDGMMVLGVTLRYRQKACTTVYYSCS